MGRRKYDKEFKKEAVRLTEHRTVKDVAESIGVHPVMIFKWKKELKERGEGAFPGNGNAYEDEIRKLHKELKEVKMERDILKKATAFFAKNQ